MGLLIVIGETSALFFDGYFSRRYDEHIHFSSPLPDIFFKPYGMKKPGYYFQTIKYPLLCIFAFMVVLELILFICFRFYEINTVVPWFLETERAYYREKRNMVQFMPECAVYDPSLAYILKPGTCTFSNVEFTTQYNINSMGVRDDEASLEQPEVIVLGDSYAMGWGVEQDETFSQIMEEAINARVLNTGISSYGTARELLLLRRLDKSRLRYVIVQYYYNDDRENRVFLENDNTLKISGREVYEEVVRSSKSRIRYKPFDFDVKFLETLSKSIKNMFTEQAVLDRGPELHRLVDVLDILRREISDAEIILFEVEKRNSKDQGFYNDLRKILAEEQYPVLNKHLTLLNVREFLTNEDRFILDGHLNQQGHRKLADRIREIMR